MSRAFSVASVFPSFRLSIGAASDAGDPNGYMIRDLSSRVQKTILKRRSHEVKNRGDAAGGSRVAVDADAMLETSVVRCVGA